jgi:hypothetical protein
MWVPEKQGCNGNNISFENLNHQCPEKTLWVLQA